MVDFRFFHAALSAFVIEEGEYLVEGLLGIIHHVSECPALTIPNEVVAGEGHFRHFGLQSGGFSAY